MGWLDDLTLEVAYQIDVEGPREAVASVSVGEGTFFAASFSVRLRAEPVTAPDGSVHVSWAVAAQPDDEEA